MDIVTHTRLLLYLRRRCNERETDGRSDTAGAKLEKAGGGRRMKVRVLLWLRRPGNEERKQTNEEGKPAKLTNKNNNGGK